MGISTKLKAFGAMRQMDNGWQLIFNRVLFPSEPVQVCRYRGLEFITDLAGGDANGAREVLTSDEYRKFLGHLDLRRDLNVLDIGSNNGGFPLLLASEGHEFKKLVCAEMNPQTAARLRFNLERNFSAAAVAVNTAVCGSEREILIAPSLGGTSENIYSEAAKAEGVRIRGTTPDDLVRHHFGDAAIDVCKVDIEGAEFEIFESDAFERLRQCRNLLIEIHHFPETPRSRVIERIEKLGFRQAQPIPPDDEGHHVHLFQRID